MFPFTLVGWDSDFPAQTPMPLIEDSSAIDGLELSMDEEAQLEVACEQLRGVMQQAERSLRRMAHETILIRTEKEKIQLIAGKS